MDQYNITVQPTNNENIVKFVTNSFLTQAKSYEFTNIDQAKPSPLAQELFYLPFVKTVYISQNFVAIEKFNIVDWPSVQDEVAQSIADYLNSDKEVITAEETLKKVPVTVYAESTPNPGVMKYVANKPLADGVFEFKSIEDASVKRTEVLQKGVKHAYVTAYHEGKRITLAEARALLIQFGNSILEIK